MKYTYILLFIFHLSVVLTQRLGCGLDCPGFKSGKGQDIFFFLLQNVQTSSGAHPATYLIGTGVRSQAVKWQEHKVNHISTSSAEFKNEWSCTSSPPICLHGTDRDHFTFHIGKCF